MKKVENKEIEALRDQFGEMIFRFGLSHLMDCGYQGLSKITDEELETTRSEWVKNEKPGSIMTGNCQADVLEVAVKLARTTTPMDLLKWVQSNLFIG